MKPLSFIIVLFCGMLFGLGLSLSNMVIPEVVINFLLFRDLGLLLVLGSAVSVAALCYQFSLRYLKSPLIEPSFRNRPVHFDWRTWLGSAIFGIGWGISGVCPGPAIAGLGVGNWPLFYVLAGIFLGAYVEGRWFSRLSGPSVKS